MQQEQLDTLDGVRDTLLWSESYISVDEVASYSSNDSYLYMGNFAVVSILVLLVVLFLIYYRRVINTIPVVLSVIFNKKRAVAIENSALLYNGRDTFLLFSVIAVVFVLSIYYGWLFPPLLPKTFLVRFVILFGGIFVYFLYRYLLSRLFSFLLKDDLFLLLNRFFLSYFSAIIIFVSIWLSLDWLAAERFDNLIVNGVYLTSGFIYLIYITRSFNLIINKEFSYFFYILYLCTLEILPWAILAYLIVN